MYRTTLRPQPRGPLAFLEGRFAALAIGAFVLLSATLALATAVMPGQLDAAVSPASPIVVEAEADMKATLDSRLHLHLKRLALR
jgi:hypothetical protein